MGEINYQLAVILLKNLAQQGLVTEMEKDLITALLKERFRPSVTLLTG